MSDHKACVAKRFRGPHPTLRERPVFWKALLVIALAIAPFGGSWVWAEEQAEDLDSIMLERTAYFFKPGGGYTMAAPGLYLLRVRDDSQLLLIPGQGRQALLVQAQSTRHQDQIQEPVALSVLDKESLLHLLLLLPDGGGLETVGAFSPVHLRSGELSTLSSEKVQEALTKKGAALRTPK